MARIEVNQKLKKVIQGLYYQPEGSYDTYKFNFINLKKADNGQAITVEKLIFRVEKIPINSPISEMTLDQFFKGMSDPDEQSLKENLEYHLTNIKVFVVNLTGKTDIYIVGVTKSGNWIGVTTNDD